MSDPSCRAFRELLGVYVVGAIEPAERATVDTHLNQCYECREELAALAVLPALLHRVPVEEAERIAAAGPAEIGHDDPAPDVLDSMLGQVRAKRRSRRVRAAFATAAAILIAAGGAAAAGHALTPAGHVREFEVATGTSRQVHVTVHYGTTKWRGTTMWVRANGLPEWTTCKFYVITSGGVRILAGGWIIGPGGGKLWYPVRASVPVASVTGFALAWGHHRGLQIPA